MVGHFPTSWAQSRPLRPPVFESVPQLVQKMAEKALSDKAPSVVSSTPSRTWKGWLWDSADVSKEERRFLLKVGSLDMPNYGAKVILTQCYLTAVGLYSFDLRYPWNVDQMGNKHNLSLVNTMSNVGYTD